jgi:hypothetical protein
MISSGSPEAHLMSDTAPVSPPATAAPRTQLIILLAVGVISLLLAAYIGVNVIGVLYGMVAPPLPPVSEGMSQTAYTQKAYGVDAWVYRSGSDGCDLLEMYSAAGLCNPAPLQCGALRPVYSSNLPRTIVARCSGERQFSIFTMQWNSYIFRLPDGTSEVELEREVFWIGTGRE